MHSRESKHLQFLRRASELARFAVETGTGGPFGAIVVRDGIIVGEGSNRVTSSNDPTAHAEVEAIREACRNLQTFQLEGCIVYSSCEPCPMCMGALYWARPDALYYSAGRLDAAEAGFDDAFIYDEFALPENKRKLKVRRIPLDEALTVFNFWREKEQKIRY